MAANVANIWAVGDGEKIRRDDLGNANRFANSVWDGKTVRLFGARNETIAFQVIVEAGSGGIEGLRVGLERLTHARNSRARIENDPLRPDDPNHYVGRRIEVFTEHYLYVPAELTTQPQWFFAESAPPLQRSGWIPDALIPHDARQGFGGQPVRVEPHTNQGFWIDVYIPDDPSLPAGIYTGEVAIRAEGGIEVRLPVELELLDFALPHETHTKTMVYASDVSAYFPGLANAFDALRFMAHRHRFDLVGAAVHGQPFDEAALANYRPYLHGDFFTAANGYEGPGQGVGEQIFPIGMYGSPVLGETRESVQAEADKWVSWFDREGWKGVYFLYLIDEPRPPKFDWINERAAWVKSSPGPGRRLPILTTRTYTKELERSIDIWCAHAFSAEEKAAADRNGQPIWFYNGYRPSHGSVILEGEAVDLRVNSWAKRKHGIDLYFIWHGTHWRHNHQGPRGRTHQNVFGYPVTFMYINRDTDDPFYGNEGVHWGNGDGILFYPGHDPFFREQDRGIQGPLSSIRIKNLRRGIQDFEYLWLAEQLGHGREADAVVNEAVPRVLHEADRKSNISWSPRGSDWDGYRRRIADLIVR